MKYGETPETMEAILNELVPSGGKGEFTVRYDPNHDAMAVRCLHCGMTILIGSIDVALGIEHYRSLVKSHYHVAKERIPRGVKA